MLINLRRKQIQNLLEKTNSNRLVLEHVNMNSIRKKFENLLHHVTKNVDILIISETKLDNSFPEGQFLIPGYSSFYHFDRNCGGEVLCCAINLLNFY